MSGSSTKTVTCNAQSNKDKRSLIPTCCQAPACCLASTTHVADAVYPMPSTNAVSSLYLLHSPYSVPGLDPLPTLTCSPAPTHLPPR